ncbi:hypothetical protein ACFLS7_05360 [Bacteroidota bacterium]
MCYKNLKPSLRYYVVIPLLILLSCSPALYLPTEEHTAKTGIPLDDLKAGRQLYIDYCGSCHMLYLPSQFSAEQWIQLMDTMRPKVTITNHEEKQIMDYLLTGK